MKRKPGRPVLPKTKARSVLVAVRMSSEEDRELRDAIRRSKQRPSDWIRATLLAAARSFQGSGGAPRQKVPAVDKDQPL